MALETKLARSLIASFPERAASALESQSVAECTRLVASLPLRDAAALLRRLSPTRSSAVLAKLPDAKVADLLETLPIGVASRLFRRLDAERLEGLLEALPKRTARGVRAMIAYPENSAGALMDPHVLALPGTLTARQALERVREAPEQARYNVYVVDQEQHLEGVINLRELFLAAPGARLTDLMVRDPLRLDARTDRTQVISHPGWKEVHSLPVVDEEGCYLGAIRYRTLRELEDALLGGGRGDVDVQEALGQLFAVGAGGLLDALTAPGPLRRGGR